jgi:hypothetical protein
MQRNSMRTLPYRRVSRKGIKEVIPATSTEAWTVVPLPPDVAIDHCVGEPSVESDRHTSPPEETTARFVGSRILLRVPAASGSQAR